MDSTQNDVAAIREIGSIPTILDVVCKTTGMGFAAVARVTGSQWIACEVLDNIHFGLEPGGELPLETTLCNEVRALCEEVVIDHVAEDAIYASHHTPALYGFQSYISVPIVLANGEFFGTLCAIDPEPRKLKGTTVPGMFRLFAQLIAFHLDANQKLVAASTTSHLREQFIAVLGHDLRNPIASIEAGRRLLDRQIEDPKAKRVLRLMGESISRVSGLIENLMDFARGRLGGGIGLKRSDGRLEPTLVQVINEMQASYPERVFETRFQLADTVEVDHARIAQMFSNLLGNAIAHGAADAAITIDARVADGQLVLSVTNEGDAIADQMMERLFQPFYRGEVTPSSEGLGLGLYIASQIAIAHGGELTVKSDADETTFAFRMPLAADREPADSIRRTE